MGNDTVSLRAPEVRTFAALEFRDTDATASGRYLEGRAVPYNVEDDVGWYMETIINGCFTKSIREAANRLPLLTWHENRTFSIGVAEKWTERDDGLWGVWDMDLEDERAVTAVRKARRGEMTGLSVGFKPIRSERTMDEETGVVHVKRFEARLLEVSLTATPAYAGAGVSLVRTAEHADRSRRSAELDAWREYLAKVSAAS